MALADYSDEALVILASLALIASVEASDEFRFAFSAFWFSTGLVLTSGWIVVRRLTTTGARGATYFRESDRAFYALLVSSFVVVVGGAVLVSVPHPNGVLTATAGIAVGSLLEPLLDIDRGPPS